jgi:hypothetical protein
MPVFSGNNAFFGWMPKTACGAGCCLMPWKHRFM